MTSLGYCAKTACLSCFTIDHYLDGSPSVRTFFTFSRDEKDAQMLPSC
ncbi:hypothetical protein Ab1vBOLIVR2_gp54c [Agrobacterium phage OLIVR2]|uniref:Uncharacterized protein n=1 Tax=Agrobacterium phage OLIVR1 TaxID=2723769 RepID=A0A858MRM4_9CAUD|nr:hypothetical protein KNU98_gp055 [Agrobacterium phage OLIVR1]QIW87249.1 hypothetical protein Ab1vBOLIVR1_gp54c [Agrobacterium phage OLIVR1]QIW87357.1 hypothetical protein Ab1vBOLIVR2_gp54c [Agrobacterium phage OLIVR2]QIW87464.1 hypothetical protein Ab1vBOLIVR3_gp54c [Agrobacterium phage OLIVR3]